MATQSKNTGKTPSNQVATQASSAVMTEMPDYLKNQGMGNRGTENVGVEDLTIPRIEVVQSLSPCRKKTDPNYIEGAEEGMLYNNVTRELYGEKVNVVPVGFVKEYIVWKDRDAGGGFRGAFPTFEAAEEARKALPENEGDDCESLDTAQQFVLVVHDDGRVEEAVVSMSKSKMKVSRKWNSLIRIGGGDSFSRVYTLAAVSEVNSKNQDYYNFAVKSAGFPSEAVYRRAEKLYEAVSGGMVQANRGADGQSEEVDTGAGGEY